MGFHRVVVLFGGGVFLVHDEGRGRQLGVEVALLRHARHMAVQRVGVRVLARDLGLVRLLFVVHDECFGGLPRLLGRLRDDQHDRVPHLGWPVALEHGAGRVGP
jgi:hypothetical protein